MKREQTMEIEISGKMAMNRAETKGIQDLERQRRIKLLRNHLILVAILNFLTVSGLICCLAYYKWFNYRNNMWVGLGYLYCGIRDEYFRFPEYIEEVCHQNSKEPAEACDIIDKFYLSGRICTAALSLGLFFHIIFFVMIVRLALEKIHNYDLETSRQIIFKPLIFKMLSMFLYISSLIFWNLYNKTYEVQGKVGVSMYAGIVACSIYLVLLIYYGILKKQMKSGVMIDNLLNPDKFLDFGEASLGKNMEKSLENSHAIN